MPSANKRYNLVKANINKCFYIKIRHCVDNELRVCYYISVAIEIINF